MSDWPKELISLGYEAIISPFHVCSIGAALGNIGATSSGVFSGANLALFIPFRISTPILIKKLAWINGSVVNGNVDFGVYDSVGRKIISTGSIVQVGTQTTQLIDIADVSIHPGQYFFALASNSATATFRRVLLDKQVGRALGCFQQESAFPLPDMTVFSTLAQTLYMYSGAVVCVEVV